MRRWGQTSYEISRQTTGDNADEGQLKYKSKNYGYDVTFARFNKYIVEGETEIFDAGLESDKDYTSDKINDKKEKDNLKKLKDYLTQKATNKEGELIVFQAGSGRLNLTNTPPGGRGFREAGIAAITGTRGGSVSRKVDIDGGITYENSKANANIKARGIQLIEYSSLTWVNSISPGDSGSGFYIYDKEKKKWLLLGVASKADLQGQGLVLVWLWRLRRILIVIKKSKWDLDLKGGNSWIFEKPQGATEVFKENNNASGKQITKDKDIVFSSGGSIAVKSNMDLMVSGQIGGLVFKKKNGGSDETTYTITSNGTNSKIMGFNGSGLDIEENVKVEWGLGFIKW